MSAATVQPDLTDPLTAPFWAGTRRGELLVQRCTDCGHLRWPPGPLCPACLSSDAKWTPVEPRGTLVSYCIYRRSFDKAFDDLVPYTVGYVQLASGPRMHGLLTGHVGELAVDSPVRAVFEEVGEEVTLIRWTAGPGGLR